MTNETLGGIRRSTSLPPASIAASTVSVNKADHAGRTIVFNLAAGITATLPAATGSGTVYRFVVGTTLTGNGIIKVANSTDIMSGQAILLQDSGDTMVGFETAADTDTITLNGTTTGGYIGAAVELEDIASGKWNVFVRSAATGTEATPFSATV